MNRIAILEGYEGVGYGDPDPAPRRRRRKVSQSRAAKAARSRFTRAAKHCKRRRKGSYRACMARELRGKRRKRRS